jgi:hypothetical protein
MTKKKSAQQYSAEEFDAVVALIAGDAGLRADIEAITGQKLDGKTPRQLFDTFRAIDRAADIQISVAKYGRARQLLRETRAGLEGTETAEKVLGTAQSRINELETRNGNLSNENKRLRAANAALNAGRGATPLPTGGQVVQGKVERPVERREVAS